MRAIFAAISIDEADRDYVARKNRTGLYPEKFGRKRQSAQTLPVELQKEAGFAASPLDPACVPFRSMRLRPGVFLSLPASFF